VDEKRTDVKKKTKQLRKRDGNDEEKLKNGAGKKDPACMCTKSNHISRDLRKTRKVGARGSQRKTKIKSIHWRRGRRTKRAKKKKRTNHAEDHKSSKRIQTES